MKFCAAAGTGDELDKRFAALSIGQATMAEELKPPNGTEKENKNGGGNAVGSGNRNTQATGSTCTKGVANKAKPPAGRTNTSSNAKVSTLPPPSANSSASASKTPSTNTNAGTSSLSTSSTTPPPPSALTNNTTTPTYAPPTTISTELSTILTAMRKLREAIVSTRRHDTFAQRAYIFIIRAGLLSSHMATYHPALLYLLHYIHPASTLPSSSLHEFTGYRILDLACRQSDLNGAYAMRAKYKYRDRKVDAILSALTHDNYVLFWRMRRLVDGYQLRIVDCAAEAVRLQALKCLGRAYLRVERALVERAAERKWVELVKRNGVGWVLEGVEEGGREMVVIRRPKVK